MGASLVRNFAAQRSLWTVLVLSCACRSRASERAPDPEPTATAQSADAVATVSPPTPKTEPPPAPAPAQDPLLDRARALCEEARAALARRDASSARAKSAEGIDLLLSSDADESGEARLRSLSDLALLAQDSGDLKAARRAGEKVLEVRSRTLPGDHHDLRLARADLASTLWAQGDLAGARKLFEQILEVCSRTLPDDHADLQRARGNLALVLWSQGELASARALQEKVLEVFSRTLPDDHPDLQVARHGLAATLRQLGDFAGARALQEKVLEVFSRTLPEDHRNLQAARANLAATLEDLGELDGALELREKVLEVLSRTMPDDHPDLQRARNGLAITKQDMGDLAGARELREKVLEVFSRTLSPDDPDLQRARKNLAVTLKDFGELAAARELEEKVLEVRARTPSADDPEVRSSFGNLADTLASEHAVARGKPGEVSAESEGRRQKFHELVEAFTRALASAGREALLDGSEREAEERCARLLPDLGRALSFASGWGVFPGDPGLEREVFLVSETTRSAVQVSAFLARVSRGDERCEALRGEMRAASEEIARLARGPGSADAFGAAVARRDGAGRKLLSRARELAGGGGDLLEFDVAALASSLSAKDALVAYRRYTRWEIAPGSVRPFSTESLCAFVVRAGGELARVELGPIEPIQAAVNGFRREIGAGPGRGVRVGAVRPERADGESAGGGDLRRRILDPLLPVLRGCKRIVVALDDVLHVVPLDALAAGPWAGSAQDAEPKRLGDVLRIEVRSTFVELLAPPSPLAGEPLLVALGGATFDAAPAGSAEEAGARGIPRGSARENGFAPLPGTLAEVRGVADCFAREFGERKAAETLVGEHASLEELLARAPRARWLHLATHGWFAPESVRSWADPEPLDARAGRGHRASLQERVKGASPMVLCGLAFAGANRPADAMGRSSGLVTAEEISQWELANCELAVISACDTNVGERKAGQGVASLQKALRMAGARSVITSLWMVPDEATEELMLDFYRRLWAEKKPKWQALWEAKTRIRNEKDEAGHPKYATRDWAAWVLTGDPQ